MNLSTSFALLVSTSIGTEMAKAISFTDFTMKGAGTCIDNAGNHYSVAYSPYFTFTTKSEAEGRCTSYCGQNLPAIFRGMEIWEGTTTAEYQCLCLFDIPNEPGEGQYPRFPYKYAPLAEDIVYYPGTGAIAGSNPQATKNTCYEYGGTSTGTASPTGVHTPAPTAGAVSTSDFTNLGNGSCMDSAGKYYTNAYSPDYPWGGVAKAESTCVAYCGQNTNANFVGLEIFKHSGDDEYECTCLFSLPDQKPPYTFQPETTDTNSYVGSGPVARADGSTTYDTTCYKWKGTVVPPFSCPAPSRPCLDAAVDCVPHGFAHCLDACCANLGSKSAKGTKSSKTSTKSTKTTKRE